MNLQDKLKRSRSTEKINFSKIGCSHAVDPLVKIESSEKILIEPCWTIDGDFEGQRYLTYIAKHPEYDGVYVRSELAKRVDQAARKLDQGLRLVIRAGHRPIDVQKRLLKDCAADYLRDHPDAPEEEALEHARTFVSDPDIHLPPHVCGAAVDVTVQASTGRLLDFGSALNDDNERSFLYYPHLSQAQKQNRLMLTTAMLDAGLASCAPEWWHFSYGDQVWAWFYGHKDSLYAPIDLIGQPV